MCIFFSKQIACIHIPIESDNGDVIHLYCVLNTIQLKFIYIDILCGLMFFKLLDATYPVPMSLYPHLYNQKLFLSVVQLPTNTGSLKESPQNNVISQKLIE